MIKIIETIKESFRKVIANMFISLGTVGAECCCIAFHYEPEIPNELLEE
ncbi:cyclic lactone autoinducer peptide (plasmid) [Paraclostridium ghonii]|nr:cyclic lactone autoinducer peptide [Paeniclostridium ghonii]MCM0167075.1 cyclic lactone autoinducer peptide [Paeniclostridium ghonii]